MDHDQASQRFVRRTWSAASRALRGAGDGGVPGAAGGPSGGRGGVEGGGEDDWPFGLADDFAEALRDARGHVSRHIADVHREAKRLERLESCAGRITGAREPGVADMDDLRAFEALFVDGEDLAVVLARERRRWRSRDRIDEHVSRLRPPDPLTRALGELPIGSVGTDGCSLDWFLDG